jgi:alpha/beta superfamily hydrolase
MTPRTERRLIEGLVGPIEIALDFPAGAPAGCAFVGHPHPLYGGTLDNKVAATLARAFAGLGWIAVRPNFRGVGKTAGTHDHGAGETDDFLHVIAQVPAQLGVAPGAQALGGFSFGSFVAARAAERLRADGQVVRHEIYVGSAAGKWPMPPVASHALVVHGEYDETIPLVDVLAWARPQDLPVVVLPGADHFFHRRLSVLKQLIVNHVSAQCLGAGAPQVDAP